MTQTAILTQVEKVDSDWSITHTEVDGITLVLRYEIMVDYPAR